MPELKIAGKFGGQEMVASARINALLIRKTQVILATDKGLRFLYQKDLFSAPLPVLFLSMRNSDGIYMPIDGSLNCSYRRDLNISFRADVFNCSGSPAQVYYMLIDADGDSLAKGQIRGGDIRLGSLPPGSYQLHVLVQNVPQRVRKRRAAI